MSPDPAPRPAPTSRRVAAQVGARLLVGWGILVTALVLVGRALADPLRDSVGAADNHVERWIADHRTGSWSDVAKAVSLLGETWTVIIVGPLLLLVVWLWLRQVRAVVFLATVILGEVAAYLITVSIVSRPRPPVPLLDPGLDPSHSYPSGHVAASAAMYGGMAVLIWLHGHPPWRRLSLGLLVLPLIVAVARLYLGAHHPSDVIASLVFMSAWLAVVTAVVLREAAPGALTPSRRGSAPA